MSHEIRGNKVYILWSKDSHGTFGQPITQRHAVNSNPASLGFKYSRLYTMELIGGRVTTVEIEQGGNRDRNRS